MDFNYEKVIKEINDFEVDNDMNHATSIEALVDNCFHSFHEMQPRLYKLLKDKKALTGKEQQMALAVTFVNNEFKHNPKLLGFTHTQQGGFHFPGPFPTSIPMPFVYWKIIEDSNDQKGFNAYQDLLERKSVKQTIIDVYNFVDKYFQIVIDSKSV